MESVIRATITFFHKMPQTEYKGSKYIALSEELRNLGVRGMLFRINYELSKKLGFIERRHPAGELSAEDLVGALNLENPDLAGVRSAYNSHGSDSAVAEFIKHLKSRESPGFFFNWRDRELYQSLLRERFAHQEAQLVKQADRVCRHQFEIFGSNSIEFGDEINWHFEPETGRDWPLEHWSKIDVRGPDRIGDVRLTWELNRHQFFLTLGRAYWFTGDEKYAQEFVSLLRGWIDANPPEMGVNWYSNLEIAMRLISWIWAYHYFLDSPLFDDHLHFNFLKIILQSCRHLARDFKYSLRSMKNNHVIGDAAALVFAGIMFPEFKESKIWREKYIDVLYQELEDQIYQDGVNFEQAISYHRFVLYFYLLLLRIMQINKYSVPVRLHRKLEKMIEFMMYAMKPDGTMPQIGDSDDARAIILSNDRVDSIAPALSTGAVLFQRGDFKNAAGELSEETFWIIGRESIELFDSLDESVPSNLSRGFPDGGYYIMRTGWDADARYMLFKCGPHAAHGHADALHIEMYCAGKSCLRDCGTYTYNGPWEWRTFFRSTRAHNTVVIDGESQSIPHRVFRWLKPANTRTLSWITSSSFDYIDAEHDGYNRYKEQVTHRRAVFFVKPGYWVIFDRLIGSGEHSIELLFHTPCEEHELDKESKIFRTQDFAIIPVAPDDLDVEVHESSEEPIQGWFSPCYGVKLPSNTLVYSFTDELPKVMVTILDAGGSILDAECSVFGEEGLAIDVNLRNFDDTLILNQGQKSADARTGINTDAAVVYLRKNKVSGKFVRVGLISGKYVRLAGKLSVEGNQSAKSVDLSVLPDGKTAMEIDPEMDVHIEI